MLSGSLRRSIATVALLRSLRWRAVLVTPAMRAWRTLVRTTRLLYCDVVYVLASVLPLAQSVRARCCGSLRGLWYGSSRLDAERPGRQSLSFRWLTLPFVVVVGPPTGLAQRKNGASGREAFALGRSHGEGRGCDPRCAGPCRSQCPPHTAVSAQRARRRRARAAARAEHASRDERSADREEVSVTRVARPKRDTRA